MKSVEATDILPDIEHKHSTHDKSFYDDGLTCVKDVASLTEKGTSRTLASVRASSVLPNRRAKAYCSTGNVIYTPEPVGPLSGDMHE
jgi:hypothetical protein